MRLSHPSHGLLTALIIAPTLAASLALATADCHAGPPTPVAAQCPTTLAQCWQAKDGPMRCAACPRHGRHAGRQAARAAGAGMMCPLAARQGGGAVPRFQDEWHKGLLPGCQAGARASRRGDYRNEWNTTVPGKDGRGTCCP